MASRLPLVAPRAGGVLTCANDENAWLAAPVADEMASAVRAAALMRGSRRTRRRENARETAGRFDWGHVCRGIFTIDDAIQRR